MVIVLTQLLVLIVADGRADVEEAGGLCGGGERPLVARRVPPLRLLNCKPQNTRSA